MPGTEHLAHSDLSKIIFLLLLFSFNLSAQKFPDDKVDSLLRSGIKQLVLQDFESAKITFHDLNDDYPKMPAGKIYLAAALIAESYDKAEEYDLDLINDYLKSAILQSEKLLEKNPDNIWYNYFLALAKGYYAYYQALNGNWLSALSDGLSAISDFEKCLKINPDFYEAYTAIGTYQYWKSRKTEFLHWLPFIDDNREAGIKLLEKSISRSRYNYFLGIYSLQWIYIDAGYPQKAIKISEQTLQEFSGSRFFKWGYARAMQEVDLYKAIDIYIEILNSYPVDNNHYNEIFLKHLIAQFYVKLGEYKKAMKLCDEILAINDIDDYVKEMLGDRLNRVRTLRQELTACK